MSSGHWEIAGVTAGSPWQRIPILNPSVLRTSASLIDHDIRVIFIYQSGDLDQHIPIISINYRTMIVDWHC